MRTRIKICGLTREEDVESVLDAGVDALGFVFYTSSPRFVSPERARQLTSLCPAWVSTVGLFVNSSREEISRISDISGINQIQLHGDESIDDCKKLSRPVVKAIRISSKKNPNKGDYDNILSQLIESKRYLDFCSAILLDADSPSYGGSGKSFNWNVLEIDGHSFYEIDKSINKKFKNDKPTFIIAHTIKGKGVSFMENQIKWHHGVPTKKDFEIAKKELTND